MKTVYIETSILGYLRNRPSSQIINAARQLLTRKWWNEERHNFETVVSQYVIDEAADGDKHLAEDRLAMIEGVPVLPHDPLIVELAQKIMAFGILPTKAEVDALHISTVAVHQIDYLLTWNCKHIANARILPKIHNLLIEQGIPIPIICTPEEFVGDETR